MSAWVSAADARQALASTWPTIFPACATQGTSRRRERPPPFPLLQCTVSRLLRAYPADAAHLPILKRSLPVAHSSARALLFQCAIETVCSSPHPMEARAGGSSSDDQLKSLSLNLNGKGKDRDLCIPVYSASEVLQKFKSKWDSVEKQPYRAMYSSLFGGITVDPTVMVIPLDDHMVHRGHGVFDTAMILDGYIYELDDHLDRLLGSASMAKIAPPFPKSTLKSILIQTTAVSQCKRGCLRYWLSAGPGDFLLSSAGCPTSAFYAVVVEEDYVPLKQGVKVTTSTVRMKPPEFATMKSVNYLPNALAALEAEEKGAYTSIWVDDDGYVAEGPNVNVAFISPSKELLLPSFDKILGGCTAKRLITLAAALVDQGLLKSVRVENITVDQAKGSAEMMLVGSGLPILPITMWDEQPIGDGKVGKLTLALSDLLWQDMVLGPETHRIPVPYV
ncbi:D-amino-acid transaminase [Nymphaea thermarum]|nr:D-amino-acid transaminase [Nymphaea thermarum]